MSVSEAPRFASELQVFTTQPAPHIVVGITHSQACLTLTGRLRALREAGFRVTLVCSPGELLDRTAAREGVELVTHLMDTETVGGIVSYVCEHKVDLLVIGLHRRSDRVSRLWSTVYTIAQNVPCSVLGVH